MTETPYCYYAILNRVVDGDTVELIIDEGFKHSWKVSCRLSKINAPELSTKEGQTSKQYLSGRISLGSKVYIVSKTLDKYGRPIIDLYFNGVLINKEIVDKGYAVVYD